MLRRRRAAPAPRHPRASSRCTTRPPSDPPLVLGAALSIDVFKVALAAVAVPVTKPVAAARWPLRRLLVAVTVAVERPAARAGVCLGVLAPQRLLSLQRLGLAVESAEDNVEPVTLGGDETYLLARASQIRGNEGREATSTGGVSRARARAAGCRGRRGRYGAGQQAVKVGAGVRGWISAGCPTRSGNTKPCEESLSIALWSGGGRGLLGLGLARRKTEYVDFEEIDGMLEVGNACVLETVVGVGNEILDIALVLGEEWVDVGFVEEPSPLGLWKDEVEEEDQPNVRVERDPAVKSLLDEAIDMRKDRKVVNVPDEDPFKPGLNEEPAPKDDPIHEPWRELGRVRGFQSLVGSENGEEEGGDGA